MVSCNCSLNAICINDCHPRIVILTSSTGEPACWPADFPCLTELEGLKICVIVKKIDSKVQWNIGMITQPLWTTNIVEQAFITDINIPSGLYSWTCSYSWNMTNSSHKCLTIFIIIWSYIHQCVIIYQQPRRIYPQQIYLDFMQDFLLVYNTKKRLLHVSMPQTWKRISSLLSEASFLDVSDSIILKI